MTKTQEKNLYLDKEEKNFEMAYGAQKKNI